MKQCPTCQSQYTDDTLQFCLQDGSPLQLIVGSEGQTGDYGEQETVVSGRQPAQTSAPPPATNPTVWSPGRSQSTPPVQPVAKKSSATFAVLATALVMLVLFGFVGLGLWYYFKGAANDPNANVLLTKKSPTPENANRATTTQANTSKTVPAATPTESSNANTTNSAPVDADEVKRDVTQRIESWYAAAEDRNFDDYMRNYAGTVDYYTKKGASLAAVRADKEKAFRAFDSINFTISNMNVTPDASGETATAVFDKEWVFEGERYSAGKVQSQLKFKKVNGQWLITSERDLKVYYTE